jgi:hypothetical protein
MLTAIFWDGGGNISLQEQVHGLQPCVREAQLWTLLTDEEYDTEQRP